MPENIARLRARCHGVSVGVFAADLGDLAGAARHLADWGCGLLHFDIMDGVFVPQLTAGPAFVAAVGQGMVRDVHLMVAEPLRHVGAFVAAGADIITVHAEAPDAAAAIRALRAEASRSGRTVLAGMAVMPGTDLNALGPLLAEAPDLLLSLAIDPRNSAPADLALAGRRLKTLTGRAAEAGFAPLLALDGGVTSANFAEVAAFGPDIVVSGSAIFKAASPAATFAEMTRKLGGEA